MNIVNIATQLIPKQDSFLKLIITKLKQPFPFTQSIYKRIIGGIHSNTDNITKKNIPYITNKIEEIESQLQLKAEEKNEDKKMAVNILTELKIQLQSFKKYQNEDVAACISNVITNIFKNKSAGRGGSTPKRKGGGYPIGSFIANATVNFYHKDKDTKRSEIYGYLKMLGLLISVCIFTLICASIMYIHFSILIHKIICENRFVIVLGPIAPIISSKFTSTIFSKYNTTDRLTQKVEHMQIFNNHVNDINQKYQQRKERRQHLSSAFLFSKNTKENNSNFERQKQDMKNSSPISSNCAEFGKCLTDNYTFRKNHELDSEKRCKMKVLTTQEDRQYCSNIGYGRRCHVCGFTNIIGNKRSYIERCVPNRGKDTAFVSDCKHKQKKCDTEITLLRKTTEEKEKQKEEEEREKDTEEKLKEAREQEKLKEAREQEQQKEEEQKEEEIQFIYEKIKQQSFFYNNINVMVAAWHEPSIFQLEFLCTTIANIYFKLIMLIFFGVGFMVPIVAPIGLLYNVKKEGMAGANEMFELFGPMFAVTYLSIMGMPMLGDVPLDNVENFGKYVFTGGGQKTTNKKLRRYSLKKMVIKNSVRRQNNKNNTFVHGSRKSKNTIL